MDRGDFAEGGRACPVCYERFELGQRTVDDGSSDGERVVVFGCCHGICRACDARLREMGDARCPVCRAERVEPLPNDHHRLIQMSQTFRKKALHRLDAPALSPRACAVLRSYAPPILVLVNDRTASAAEVLGRPRLPMHLQRRMRVHMDKGVLCMRTRMSMSMRVRCPCACACACAWS